MNFHSLLAQVKERMKSSRVVSLSISPQPTRSPRREFLALMSLAKSSGFTMIELLVVIAVIGILAVAVLSSINPIEQINKGRDTGKRSDIEQLLNAADRYYAIQAFYPWNHSTGTYTTGNVDPDTAFSFDPATGNWRWLDDLVTTAEVKQGFINRVINENAIYLYKPAGTNTTLYGCFIPTSYAFKLEAALACQNDASHHLTIGSVSTCITTNGVIDDNNMICLP